MKKLLFITGISGALLLLSSCQSPYYKAMESMGIHKREILVDRVQDGKEAQQDAKEQFQSALEKFSELTQYEGGKLQEAYDKLNKELKRTEDRAKKVSDGIDAIEDVSKELFKEWERELDQFQNQEYRKVSEQQLEQTYARYNELIQTMKRAEISINPVLSTFRDQVLFLKHNLNAQAIASLDTQSEILKSDIQSLVKEMEASIAEADSFIESMNQL